MSPHVSAEAVPSSYLTDTSSFAHNHTCRLVDAIIPCAACVADKASSAEVEPSAKRRRMDTLWNFLIVVNQDWMKQLSGHNRPSRKIREDDRIELSLDRIKEMQDELAENQQHRSDKLRRGSLTAVYSIVQGGRVSVTLPVIFPSIGAFISEFANYEWANPLFAAFEKHNPSYKALKGELALRVPGRWGAGRIMVKILSHSLHSENLPDHIPIPIEDWMQKLSRPATPSSSAAAASSSAAAASSDTDSEYA